MKIQTINIITKQELRIKAKGEVLFLWAYRLFAKNVPGERYGDYNKSQRDMSLCKKRIKINHIVSKTRSIHIALFHKNIARMRLLVNTIRSVAKNNVISKAATKSVQIADKTFNWARLTVKENLINNYSNIKNLTMKQFSNLAITWI